MDRQTTTTTTPANMDRGSARALADAGYMPVSDYVQQHGQYVELGAFSNGAVGVYQDKEIRDPFILKKIEEGKVAPPPLGQLPGAPLRFGPLLDRAPVETAETIRKATDAAAAQIVATADEVMHVATALVATAQETAASMREMGEAQAAAVERALNLVRDVAQALRAEQDKVRAFRNGQGEAA